jgi:hypothetical protein
LTGSTEIVWQVISYREIFEIGYHPPTLGKITTSHVNCAMKGPQRGSFRETRSQIGEHQDRVHSYGSMENVSYDQILAISEI